MTRRKVLEMASIACLKELYSKVQPSVTWEDFEKQNKEYSEKYKEWHIKYNHSMGEEPSLRDYCGPAPYEFYYLPKEIMKEICDSYVYAYKIDTHQNFIDAIDVLKSYCKEPIIDKWIEGENGDHGYRGYDHPDNLEKELYQILREYFNDSETDPNTVAKEIQDKFFEFLDMAGRFYNWNADLNGFNTEVYLGPSPNSNKERVIENWKKYRNKDIKIDDSIYIEEE